MKKHRSNTRSKAADDLTYRTVGIRAEGPATLDDKSRSVEVVGATESPAEVWDWERYDVVNEILLMSGMELPASRQVVLLDSHSRYGTGSVLGSYRDMAVAGDELIGRAHFSAAPEVESTWLKVKERHVTDFSVGYRVLESQWIAEGETARIGGRTYTGPVRVTTKWRPRELSVTPIGADERAKARAERQPQPQEGTAMKMDEKTRAALIRRGMPADATDEQAWAYLDTLPPIGQRTEPAPPPPANNVPDLDAARREAAEKERTRAREITAMCARFDVPADVVRGFVDGNKTVEEARAAVMDLIDKRRREEPPPEPGFYGNRISYGADERDKFRSAAEDAIIIRLGRKIEKPAAGAMDLAGWSMVELARTALRMANLNPNGRPIEMMGRAMTSSDFPYILAAVANKSLFEGWDTAEETWPQWVGTGSVSDFKTHTSVRASEMSDLEEVPEDAEYNYGTRTEAQEQYAIATYGKIFAITRQAMINDDLNALSDIPKGHGESANRKVGDVVYAVLTANAAMGDSVALFYSTHSNLASGGDADPVSIATLAYHIKQMKGQKDLQGLRRLNIRPVFYIAPVAAEGASEVFFRSERFSDTNTIATDSSLASTRVNPYAGTYLTRIYEARLDDNSTTAWYLAAAKGKTVKVFFLDGVQKPYMESRDGWTVDGVEYKVRIDCGAKAMDWRGLAMNPGT